MATKTQRFGATAALVAAALSGGALTCVNIAVAMPAGPGSETTDGHTSDGTRFLDRAAPRSFLTQSPFARAAQQ